MKRLLILILCTVTLFAQIPDGYYDAASGLTGDALQQALHDIIDDHTVVSYTSLWTHFQTTDVKSNGKVWDMYSDVPGGSPADEYTFVTDQCGNYSGEGSCYNREHSWPKSWFNDTSPMNTDLGHLVPTYGYVNNRRGNYPYGEVSNPSWTSTNNSKVGPNTYPGYSGTVFEPINEYKGDFARMYFYMSTRYLGEDNGWPGSPMTRGAQLESWALEMMLTWHASDTVSQKEIDRGNAVYGIQHNRNPYIDHPEYTTLIWENPTSVSLPAGPMQQVENPELISSYPNPFNGVTMVYFRIVEAGPVTIEVFNLEGQVVSRVLNSSLSVGYQEIKWFGVDQQGNELVSGV